MSDTSPSSEDQTPPAAPAEQKPNPWQTRKERVRGFLLDRRVPNWAVALGFTLAGVCSLILVAALAVPAEGTRPVVTTVEHQAFLGRPMQEKVTFNRDRTGLVWEDAHFRHDTGKPHDTDIVNTLIKALGEKQNLENWHLCGLELEAQATALRGHLRNYLAYPAARGGGVPNDTDIAYIATWHHYAEALWAAAQRAADWRLACTDPNAPVAHQLEFRITTANGYKEDIILSDYNILENVLPLEAYKILQKCEKDVQSELQEWEKTPPDKKRGSYTGDVLTARLTMLKWADLPHC